MRPIVDDFDAKYFSDVKELLRSHFLASRQLLLNSAYLTGNAKKAKSLRNNRL